MRKTLLLSIPFFGLLIANAQKTNFIQRLNGSRIDTGSLIKLIHHLVDSAHIAGLQVAVINQGTTAWTKSFGWKDVEQQRAMNDSTIMYAASLTKPVSAYLFLRLVDKGIFDIDKPVHQYLPRPIAEYAKWKDLAEDTLAFNKITARMLLSHSSGMPVLRAMYKDKTSLIAKPGEKFYYSNEGMNFLGFIIETYTGRKLEQLAKEEIYIPLHMQHTSMIWDSAFVNNFSYAYYKDGSKYGSERRESSRAAGSMSSTASDYAKFVRNLMHRQGLSPHLYDQFFSPQIYIKTKRGFGPERDTLTHDNDAVKLAWGLGLGVISTPYGKAIFHAGHGEANQNYFLSYPDKDIAIVLFSNSENFESVAELILQACIADRSSPLAWLGYGAQ